MSPSKNKVIDLSIEMMLTPDEISRRKEFLDLTESDAELLREFHDDLESIHAERLFAEQFYSHLQSFPDLQTLLPDVATINRLKDIQAKYFLRLTAGDYGEEYVLDRIKVGYTHQKIGLDTKWYIGAYRKYLSIVLNSFSAMSGYSEEKRKATFDALLKVVFFDMGLALDTYSHDTRKELLHLANHDALTGLPNRILLNDRIEQAILHSHRAKNKIAVLFIDLDRFKNINDSLGHHIGDQVISAVSVNILESLREGDTVARVGGDEFVVVLSDIRREEYIASIAEQILNCIERPIYAYTHELYVSASIGIAIYPMDGESSDELLKNADAAMYKSKREGCRSFRFYQQDMNAFTPARFKLETRLRQALEKNEFVLHYQPQIEMSTGHIVGVEALIRWQTDEGMIPPADFIPLAEETGLIIAIGEWALKNACQQAVAWHKARTIAPFRVAVNLSALQFRGQDIAETVSRILEETGCKSEWLELEITESTVMEQPERVAETLNKLDKMNVTIAIDDFGTGYSSLAYLKRFPIRKLKIDRSFVVAIVSDHDDASIVRAVIALAHSMKLQVTGEGIENREQLDYLFKLGCDYAQGYLISVPLPFNEIGALLSDASGRFSPNVQPIGNSLNSHPEIPDFDSNLYRDCRVLRNGDYAICLASESNCGYLDPQGNHCVHPLARHFYNAEADY